ncbi:MAG: histidine--tRNA ligase [Dehalococcoidia bacterium]|nr:histidine--tRNA ligase [Dehalococcoidia bacterium]
MQNKAPRGTSDILPDEQAYWEYIRKQAASICHLYGYQKIDTPIFEETSLFTRGVGKETEVVQKQMYTLEDEGGTSITLRPEGTAPVCRSYIEHGMRNLSQPVKLYYIAPTFRYERPQAGRYRQHWQFGFEAIGENNPSLDAEIIEMVWQFYKALGLNNLSLKLNCIGCKLCRPSFLDALKQYYSQYTDQLCPDCKNRLTRNPLRLLDCKNPTCQQLSQNAPKSTDHLCEECSTHFEQLKQHLNLLEIPFKSDTRLVRGLDYYTKTVFELQPSEEGSQSAIGGGGRYDGLIEELGGQPTPAIGFATGIERIILNLKRDNITIPSFPGIQVYVAHMGEEAKLKAIKLTAELRHNGIATVASLGSRSLKAQMRQANTFNVAYTVIIGEDELKNNTVMLKDMSSGQQSTVSRTELISLLISHLSL